MQVAAFYPNFFHVTGIAYAALSVIEGMQTPELHVSLMGITSGKDLHRSFYHNAIPARLNSVAYRLLSEAKIKQIAEYRYFHALSPGQITYIWPGASLDLYEKLTRNNHPIVMESVNTHQATSKIILDAEYTRLGLPLTHGVTDEETVRLAHAQYVYSCSPCVRASLIQSGVAAEKILDTSYGLKATDIFDWADIEARQQHREVTAIFVGTIGVRKGPHLLLDYWCRAKVQGKLKLVGHIQPEVAHLIAPYLARDDIEHIPFVNDLTEIYKQADIFVLPSLEEGSPLVSYMALGAGLPAIVSPMGAGGIIAHEKEGFVIAPDDDAAWIAALQRLMSDIDLRKQMSAAAYHKAPDYLWAEVGRKRAQLLLNAYNRAT